MGFRQNFFFFGLGHGLGPNRGMATGPRAPDGPGLGLEKNPFNKRVGSGYEKTRSESDPFPFLNCPMFSASLYYAVCFLLASSGRVLYGLYCGRYVE